MIEKECIRTPYGSIAAYKKGTGTKSVLLLHGAGCDSTMLSWREVFNTFTDPLDHSPLRSPCRRGLPYTASPLCQQPPRARDARNTL